MSRTCIPVCPCRFFSVCKIGRCGSGAQVTVYERRPADKADSAPGWNIVLGRIAARAIKAAGLSAAFPPELRHVPASTLPERTRHAALAAAAPRSRLRVRPPGRVGCGSGRRQCLLLRPCAPACRYRPCDAPLQPHAHACRGSRRERSFTAQALCMCGMHVRAVLLGHLSRLRAHGYGRTGDTGTASVGRAGVERWVTVDMCGLSLPRTEAPWRKPRLRKRPRSSAGGRFRPSTLSASRRE